MQSSASIFNKAAKCSTPPFTSAMYNHMDDSHHGKNKKIENYPDVMKEKEAYSK
jgi:hypothetical protein